MDLIVGYVAADAGIKGICLQDYQNKEEYIFTTFIKLTCSAFNDLLKQNFQTKQENLILAGEKKREEDHCKKLTQELTNLRNNQAKLEICEKCVANEEDRHKFEQRYTKLEKQLKKCAFIINSSLDGDNKVLGRVREIVSQSVVENNNPQECVKAASQREPELPKTLATCEYSTNMKPEWWSDDGDTSILAPSSPEGNDMDTQLFGGPGEDVVLCIPETVPFDHPQQGTTTQKFFRNKTCALSPIIYKKPSSKLTVKKAVSPVRIQAKTPPKKSRINSETSLDDSVYSPPILTDFGLPTRSSAFRSPAKQRAEDICKKIKAIRPLATKNLHENDHPQQISKKCIQPSLTEKQQRTPTSQRNKSLKQTKLTLGRLANDVAPEPTIADTVKTRMPTKTVRVSPPAIAEKRRRRGKDPEDWDCKECYKLFQKAVAAKKIDVRKMPVTMNFCDIHFNRYSYYLNTPPNFWDCGIGKPPRNGHLHPLDASAAQGDDEDF